MLYELFQSLPDKAKCQHLKNFGTFVTTRQEGGCWVNLYQLGDYFVEVYFRITDNMILKVTAMNDFNHLDNWVEAVDLSELNVVLK